MKRLKVLYLSLLTLIICDVPAWANVIDEIVKKMAADNTEDAIKNVLNFDGTTIWVLIASLFISMGLVGLASQVAQAFGGAQLGGSVSNAATASVTAVTGAAMSLAGKGGKAVTSLVKEHKKAQDLKNAGETRSAGSKNYEEPQANEKPKENEAPAPQNGENPPPAPNAENPTPPPNTENPTPPPEQTPPSDRQKDNTKDNDTDTSREEETSSGERNEKPPKEDNKKDDSKKNDSGKNDSGNNNATEGEK